VRQGSWKVVAWRLGERSPFSTTLELGNYESSGLVRVNGPTGPGSATVPAVIDKAATEHFVEAGADGYLLTHFLMESRTVGMKTEYQVEVWGHLLVLDDLGPMDRDRADLRRLVDNLTTPAAPTGRSVLGGVQ